MQKMMLLFILVTLSIPSFSKVLPVETFFKDVAYRQVQISPNGKMLAFTYDDGLSINLAILDLKDHKILSSFDYGDFNRITSFFWKRNDRIIFEVQKVVGFLDNSAKAPTLVAANVDGRKARQLFAPGSARYTIASRLPNDPEHILINRYHWGDGGETKLHKIDVDTGINDYVAGEYSGAQTVVTDILGNPRFSVSYEEEDEDEFGKGTWTFLYKATPESEWTDMLLSLGGSQTTINPLGFSADGKTVYISADVENKAESIYAIDMIDLTVLKIHNEQVSDTFGGHYNHKGALEAVRYSPDYNEYVFVNKDGEYMQIMKSLYATFPNEEIEITSFTEGGSKLVFKVSSHKNPGDFYLFDQEQPSITYLMSSRPNIEPASMGTMTPFTMNARDGLELRGYLTLPKDKQENLPTIVMVHGGPHGPRDFYGFNPEAQFFANRGYAVVQINFRGSGGYGDAFEEAGYRKWGREMQDDVTDATLWAVEQGYADKDRLCIYGGSYGGYSALMGVVREPDLYQCAMGYVGVYSMPIFYTHGDIPKRASGVKYLERVIGTDQEVMLANSPAYNVDKIKAALFIAHGKKDVRVPMEQYYALTEALDKIGKPYESMLREEGHGYSLEKNRYDLYNKMITFFDKHTKK
jgi:dipeptidyl aminopeptidase/acylaminoacyl peptidase